MSGSYEILESELLAYGVAVRAMPQQHGGLPWATFSAAAAAATVMATTADAGIIYSGVQNASTTPQTTYSGGAFLALDLDGDSADDVRLFFGRSATYSPGLSFVSTGQLMAARPGAQVAANGIAAVNFPSGASIGASATFANGGVVFARSQNGAVFDSDFQWNAGNEAGFAGVEFDGQFGWIRIEIASNALVAVDWAYEDAPGVPISAGATVPEPTAGALTGLGLLALGAAGVRRSRAQRTA